MRQNACAAANREVREARNALRETIVRAHREQIPFAAIARASGLSRERVRQL